MKKILLKTMFLMLFFGLMVSCSSDGSGNDEEGDAITSITLTANSSSIYKDEFVTFTVKDNLNNNVTGQTVFKIDGVEINNPHTFNVVGTFSVEATYNSLTDTKNITVSELPEPTSISLQFLPDSPTTTDEVSFVVTTDLGVDVTSMSDFTIDGVEISSPYIFSESGDYEVHVQYSDLSTTGNISVSRGFSKKILLEDYTGTWCQYCPGAAAAISSAKDSNSNIFSVGYHISYSSTQGIDPMQIDENLFFANQYGVNAFPTVFYDGAGSQWNFPNMFQLNNELSEQAALGLSLDSNLNGSTLDINIKIGFNQVPSEEIRLMVYLIEDNVTTSTPQSGSSQGANFVHSDVLRDVYTDTLGDIIPIENISLSSDYEIEMNGLSLPSNVDNVDDLKLITFVKSSNSLGSYQIYNVQEVHVGSFQDFD